LHEAGPARDSPDIAPGGLCVTAARFGLSEDNVIELVPYREIRSRLISGDLKASDLVTRIVEVAARVHIVNSGRYTPNIWVPPIVGPALIESEMQKQFGEIRSEILRRSAMVRPQT
jgi:hypothetical protein